MGWFDDELNKKHALYLFLLFCTWVSCCVIFGGDLHQTAVNQTTTSQATATSTNVVNLSGHYYFNTASVSQSITQTQYTQGTSGNSNYFQQTSSGSIGYKQCQGSGFDFCSRCYSGGAGAIAMAVFAFLGLLVNMTLRGLVMAGKNSSLPMIGDDQAKYALVERVTNWTVLGLYVLSMIAWIGGCMAATASERGFGTLIPTGFIYVVLCLFSQAGAIRLLQIIHEETGFGTGGSGTAKPNTSAPAVSAPTPAPATNAV